MPRCLEDTGFWRDTRPKHPSAPVPVRVKGELQGALCPELAQSLAVASPGHRKLGILRGSANTELCWNDVNSLMFKVTAKSQANLSPSTIPRQPQGQKRHAAALTPMGAALSWAWRPAQTWSCVPIPERDRWGPGRGRAASLCAHPEPGTDSAGDRPAQSVSQQRWRSMHWQGWPTPVQEVRMSIPGAHCPLSSFTHMPSTS